MDPSSLSEKTPGSLLGAPRGGLPLPARSTAGFLLAVIAVVLIAFLSYRSLQAATTNALNLAQSIAILSELESLLSTLKDAETGQRGYLLTGDEKYLEPYLSAQAELPGEISKAEPLLSEHAGEARRLEDLENVAKLKMDELESTVDARRAGRADAALAIVRTDQGKTYMDKIRSLVGDMENAERERIAERSAEARKTATLSLGATWGGSGLLLVLIAGAAAVSSREFRRFQSQSWIRVGQMGLSERMQGDQPLERLGANLLSYLAEYVRAQVGALYIAEGGQYRRFAGYAMTPAADASPLRPGDGLVGQAVKDNRTLLVRSVPTGYLPIVSATGAATPTELLIQPASIDGVVHAVMELGFFGETLPEAAELLSRASEPIAAAVRASKDRQRLEELLQETQRQSEELQAGQEELRVSNEELEEQGRALRESHASLEAQQQELQYANARLEEQTQLLEQQRDALAKAHSLVTARSDELRRANAYKSEFLANMSHELRTPLNSTLILAKLLADNKEGNLTEQQVKFAQTISSAGNDLLLLINDVLDLSKIEAGKVDLALEKVAVAAIIENLVKHFQPSAEHAALRFSAKIEPGVPEFIQTDPQRLSQILKNLLSNAFKFTDKGEVAVSVSAAEPGILRFAVRDTGVGIAPQQREVIFEAFRQADGSIHRRYGGTGLGLSISRDLATLLGGAISVQSELGVGSTFSLSLPAVFKGPREPVSAAAPAATTGNLPAAAPEAARSMPLKDDRHSIAPGGRVILVIEDDAGFAMILRDLVQEMGFQCIAAGSASEGREAATRYQPSAILLDVNLPDHSGLALLDQLKRDSKTRHIPVHMISVGDYRREAMALGAIGYLMKPAQRQELIDALRRLEAKCLQSMRHVLVVEDDARQRESICQLLGSGDVRITAVASAGDALAHLKATTFDCMVVDFNLPDFSGYALLEKMSLEEEVSFPPVIIYTGRALTRDEEQRLRRFSKSIIIKDARSPERLLDEVTLFIHQVESQLPPERQQMLKTARSREAALEGRRVLVAEDDVRNVFALTSVLEPRGVVVLIARNGREALATLENCSRDGEPIDLVLMDIMMPEMDGLTAMREIRKQSRWKSLPIIALTAKAMADDQERCLAAGANDYIAKPLDVEKLLSLVRVWLPK